MNKYSNPKILPRTKGQRLDKAAFGGARTLMDRMNTRGIPSDCKVVQVGEGLGFDSFGQQKPVFYFEVTMPNGDVVPCYSFTAGTQSDGYMICQDYSHKIAKA